jgi:NAD(P)-dependent dehydrogenase (short-subunit alcohol dehydrogenase family)
MIFDFEVLFGMRGKTAVVTGGGGVLCAEMCQALAKAGARLAVLDRSPQAAGKVAAQIQATGGAALPITADVLDPQSLQAAATEVAKQFGPADILINGAGGNHPDATTSSQQSFFDLTPEAIDQVLRLNFNGTLLPCQIFGKQMAAAGSGAILNIASLNAIRPLTRIPAYSAAKAAVANFTQWLAVHMAQEYSPRIRVNALAPGFFLTEQNHYLLVNPQNGGVTERGQRILAHTPMGRFGAPADLLGTMFWLLSPAAEFVTGVVIPVDGGFSAYSGV